MRLAAVALAVLWIPACYIIAVARAARRRMPKRSKPAAALPADGGQLHNETRRALPFAHSDNGAAVWDTRKHPHIAVAGVTGMGKTVALHAIIRQAVVSRWDVVLIDPKLFELVGFTGHPGVRYVAHDGPGMERMIHDVKAELGDRQKRRLADELAHRDPQPFQPLLLVVDEVTELVDMTGGSRKSTAVAELGSIMRLGRALDIHVAVATQQFDVKEALPSSVRRQCDAQLALGRLGRIGRQMLGWTEEQDAAPPESDPGRGTFICGAGGHPRQVRVDYAPPPKPVAKPAKTEQRQTVEKAKSATRPAALPAPAAVKPSGGGVFRSGRLPAPPPPPPAPIEWSGP